MRAILIDDEVNALDALEFELNAYCTDVEVIKKCVSPTDGIQAILELNPDLIFLDIEMPWMTGFELLEKLGDFSFNVIFVTAFDQYAIKAFEVNAVDYLLKPIEKEKLMLAVNRAKERRPINQHVVKNIMDAIKETSHPKKVLPHIAIPTPEGLEFLKISTIVYVQADSNYSTIHLNTQKSILLAKTLKDVERLVRDYQFLRVHQSYLVNLEHIKKYKKGQGGYLIMDNGETIPVSRNNKDKLMRLLR